MKLAGLFERINDPVSFHRKMIVLWETSHSFEKGRLIPHEKCLLVFRLSEVPEAEMHVLAGPTKASDALQLETM